MRLRTDSHGNSEDSGGGGLAPGPALRPAPTPAAASRRSPPPPPTTALQLSGKGLWGMWGRERGLAQPTSPPPGGGGLGQSREGTGKWGFQSISGVGPQPSLHPDLLTQ